MKLLDLGIRGAVEESLVLDDLFARQQDLGLGVGVALGNQSRFIQGFGHVGHGSQINHSIATVSSTVSDTDGTHVAHIVLVQQKVLQREIRRSIASMRQIS